MTEDFTAALRRSLERTRAGDPAGATRLIQEALSGGGARGAAASPGTASKPSGSSAVPVWIRPGTRVEDAEVLDDIPGRTSDMAGAAGRARRGGLDRRTHAGPHGARDYLIHVPAGAETIRGILVMLHGCTQNAADFARGAAMDAQADAAGFVVIYPEQTRGHNAQGCWNWFRPGDQAAGAGEPAILADLASAVAREFDVPNGRVFAAGLSAGGAMAAILGQAHPDIFGAVGVHSGLAPGSACDVVSAFAAMRGDGGGGSDPLRIPAIVFQGLADHTVAPVNAGRLTGELSERVSRGETHGGRRVERISGRNAAGAPVEVWRVEGLGHAWAGGSPAGSYTDPAGPDASAEMMRFFVARSDG